MSLKKGAQKIIEECLQIEKDEKTLVLNDGNDQDLIDSLLEVLKENGIEHELLEYEEPENQGEEPPAKVAEEMKKADVVIAPTLKSLSHTDARRNANKAGTRVATLPEINKTIWNSSLQADYLEVKKITQKAQEKLKNSSTVRVETPTGTELKFNVETQIFDRDTGILNQEGDFGNLPAGETSLFPAGITGTLVIDHFPYAPRGTKAEIKDGKVVSIKHPDEAEDSHLSRTLEELECGRKIAEFGFGTNPEATLIENELQDEKVLGTIHIAFGDNMSYVNPDDERKNPCDIHWDTICEDPTVWFDDEKVLDEGEPVFLEK
jgi:leucyl aminopeptidase (aminopeptidase T)